MIYRSVLIAVFLWLCPLQATQESLPPKLTTQDIRKVLGKIFSEHLTHKTMDNEVMRRSIQLFVNQFDPDRCYLLASEAGPFMNVSNNKVAELVAEFNRNNYSFFRKMEDQFCKAIERSRDIRKKFNFSNLKSMGVELEKGKDSAPLQELAPFPQQLDDLEARIRVKIVRLIQQQAAITKGTQSFEEIVNSVQRNLIDFENSYLGVGKDGKLLGASEKEDLFAFHVLKAVMASLDAHSSFLDPKQAKSLKMELQRGFDGIGVVLDQKGKSIFISKMLENSPAILSGQIQVGDELIAVDGKNVENKPLDYAVECIQGKFGTTIKLQIRRHEKLITVALTRGKVVMQDGRVDTSFEKVDGGIIGKITLHAFYEGNGVSAADDVKKAILGLQKAGTIKGLILDLRDNRGGFLMQAVKVAGLFMKTGVVVVAKMNDGKETFYRDLDPSCMYDGPLIVLTSRATASAAEIVAEALKDYGIALIVGDDRTYGKGSIQSQTVTDGRNDPALKVTVGQYYSVSGNSTQIEGVKADITVPSVFFDARLGEEFLYFPIKEGELPASFDDKLADVSWMDRAWYVKYYLPYLQKKRTISPELVEKLKKRSLQRILANDQYQEYLMSPPESLSTNRAEETTLQKRVWDLQMQETVNVMRDWVRGQ